jgi:putative hydrolase of the HAD superfamily
VRSTRMSSGRASGLDAVTVDAMGTIVDLDDPAPRLQQELAERGVERSLEEVAAAFRAEVAYYLPRTLEGRDEASLADLGRRCTAVFLEHAHADLDPEDFTPAFLSSIVFRPLAGAAEALGRLHRAGLSLACVSNWDVSLRRHLEESGLAGYFTAIVSSAEAGAAKPDPEVFRVALARLGVEPGRALHIGDGETDRDGAAAAGVAFEPTPVCTLPERLGLGRRP